MTVKLPVIPGYEYTREFRVPRLGDWGAYENRAHRINYVGEGALPVFILRPIPPATVTVTLTREDAKFIFDQMGQIHDERIDPARIRAIISDALRRASNAEIDGREKCGREICDHRGRWVAHGVESSDIPHAPDALCVLPVNHAGNHQGDHRG